MDRAPSTPVRMVVTVLLTCMVSASALTATYAMTRDRIIEQEKAAERVAMEVVLPDAETFELDEGLLEASREAAGEVSLDSVYRAEGPDGVPAGWGVRVGPRGYSGPIEMVVGLDREGIVTGVSIIAMTETPGLGTKIATEPGWIDQFTGWEGADIDSAAKDFDSIAGATRSSVAVRDGVMAAGRVYAEVLAVSSGQGETP